MDYFPEIVQVIPHEDFVVSVYFSDGKIVLYDIKPFLHTEVFSKISDVNVFMEDVSDCRQSPRQMPGFSILRAGSLV